MAMTNAEKQKKYRNKKNQTKSYEVRGIKALKELHPAIKKEAKRVIDENK